MNEGLASQLIKKNLEERNPYLDLGNCGLSNLDDIPELFDCVHLETLVLSDGWREYENGGWVRKESQNKGDANKLNTLSSKIKRLKNLNKLVCFPNEITDYAFLKDLTQLTTLSLSFNQIMDISFLKNLTQLTTLELSENQITDITVLKDLKEMTNLDLSHNPIPYIPKEIYQSTNCIEELRAYWSELEASQKVNNNQLKIMFLGNGCAGKTTLLHWFIDNQTVQNILSNEDIQDYTTRGLDISTISVNAKSGHKIKSFKT